MRVRLAPCGGVLGASGFCAAYDVIARYACASILATRWEEHFSLMSLRSSGNSLCTMTPTTELPSMR